MRVCFRLCFAASFVLFITASPLISSAQTSAGYAEPEDISNLLDYRLPDWTYRVWDAGLDLNGGGSDKRYSGDKITSNGFTSIFRTHFSQDWESEIRHLSLSAELEGAYSRSHDGNPHSEETGHRLSGGYDFWGSADHYLGDSPFSLLVSAASARSYSENIQDRRLGDIWVENNSFRRRSFHRFETGFGVGRIRNVVPLLRAQRLSERLMALDRPGLSSVQIKEIAQILASEYGYRMVFDRSNRHFWDKVLTPMLEPNNPLSPFEIFYLADTLNEVMGERRQGLRFNGNFEFQENNGYIYYPSGFSNSAGRSRTPNLNRQWYHKRSLTQQIHFSGAWNYSWVNAGGFSYQSGWLDVSLGHLWSLTDRIRVYTDLDYRGESYIPEEQRSQIVTLNSTFQYFLEDQVSLNVRIGLNHQWARYQTEENLSWAWTYRLGLDYHLDRWIF